MKFFLASVIALGLAASTAFAQLTINTPENSQVVQCQPLEISWSGGTGPYFLSIVPGADPAGQALLQLGTFSGTSATWNVNLAVGLAIVFTIKDSTGVTDQTASVTIQPATTSCNTSSLSVSPSTGAAPATGSSGSTSTGSSNNSPATTTPSTPNTVTGTGVSTSGPAENTGASSSSTSSTSTKSAGASRVNGQFAAAGIIGAAMVALLG